MAVTIVGTAVYPVDTSTTVDTITLPTGIQAGDGALLFFGYASGAITVTIADTALSTPFVQVGATATFSGHQSQVWVAQNLAAADSGKSFTLTQSTGVRMACFVIVYRGVSRTAMVNAFASRTSTALSTTAMVTPTVTASVGGCVELGLVCATRTSQTPQIATVTPPAGTTLGAQDFEPAAGAAVTTAAVGAWEGHNFTPAAVNATLGGDTYTTDVGASYSAWALALAPSSTGPTVDAGAQQVVPAGSVATLAGSESAAAGTTITGRAWTQVSGPALGTGTLATTAAYSPTVTTPGEYVLRYTVTASDGTSASETVSVFATTANARPSGTAAAGIWTASTGTSLSAVLADELDTTYIQAVNPSGAPYVCNLDPAPVGGKTIAYRLQLDPATPGTATFLVEYLNGGNGTVIASKNETVSTSAILAGSFTLTDAQAAAVTDPLRHQLRITATAA
jgi:hypothetical protein